jgi:phasin family protein
MTDASQPFTDMSSKIWEHHQKNVDAMSRSWQAMAGGATAVANKQREIVEATMKDMAELARDFKPTGSAQELFAKQAEFAMKAVDKVITNGRDIAELVEKSGSEALAIVNERVQQSVEEIRSGLEKR